LSPGTKQRGKKGNVSPKRSQGGKSKKKGGKGRKKGGKSPFLLLVLREVPETGGWGLWGLELGLEW